jgi:hypothetical protein
MDLLNDVAAFGGILDDEIEQVRIQQEAQQYERPQEYKNKPQQIRIVSIGRRRDVSGQV